MENKENMDVENLKKIRLKFERRMGEKINEKSSVKVVRTNHITSIKYVKNKSGGGIENIVKIDQDNYLNMKTAEICKYKHSENRMENLSSVMRSMEKLRQLINNNFVAKEGEYHITLTYKKNMQDVKQLYEDFKYFWKQFKQDYPESEYICVVEPQGRGAWHCHVLVDTKGKYIKTNNSNEQSEMNKYWKHGTQLTVQALNGVADNLGAYLSGYFGDIPADEIDSYEIKSIIKDIELEGNDLKYKELKGKKFVKGLRLRLYPVGTKIYRCSRGIKIPEKEEMTYKEAVEKYNLIEDNKVYSQTLEIKEDEAEIKIKRTEAGDFSSFMFAEQKLLNKITYEYYNEKRIKKQ